MADLRTRICGLELSNPFILASGPLSHDGEAILRAHRAGAGVVVTKTISRRPAENPVLHIAKVDGGLLNCERWSDLSREDWIKREIPLAKEGGATVIASVGLTPADVKTLAHAVAKAGADALEIVSYDGATLAPMVREAVHRIDIPVLAKVSANWPDVAKIAAGCLRNGAAGITAVDSLGPALRLDVKTQKPLLGSRYGWLSGHAIFPIALRVVAEISLMAEAPVVGTGGIASAEDCVEMLMAGACALGLCTLPLTEGLGVFATLATELSSRLEELGYERIKEVVGAALPFIKEEKAAASSSFTWEEDCCSNCGICVLICPYVARTDPVQVDPSRCRFCGLCSSACPTSTLSLKEERCDLA